MDKTRLHTAIDTHGRVTLISNDYINLILNGLEVSTHSYRMTLDDKQVRHVAREAIGVIMHQRETIERFVEADKERLRKALSQDYTPL